VIGLKYVDLQNRKSKCDRLFEHDSLSNYVQLKKWNEYYFINLTEDSLWTVGLIKTLKNGDITVSFIDAESDSTIKLISEITAMKINYYDDEPELYIVDPNHNELKKMIDDGAFSIQYNFQRIGK
jgi:hypothetical protein